MKRITKQFLSLLLVIAMLAGFALPANANTADGGVTFRQVDNSSVSVDLRTEADDPIADEPQYADTDVVRVSIILKDQSTLEVGFPAEDIAHNNEAMAYRARLQDTQETMTAALERKLGGKLDVVWNLTLSANIISANVQYGQIEAIESVRGVEQVLIEICYAPDVVSREETADPNMATSGEQIGSALAWSAGYTGAGSRIAVIDTGADVSHQSLDEAAFQYSLAYRAGLSDLSLEEYLEELDLLDAEEIASVAALLNAPIDPESAYVNAKIPFGYNYVDEDYDILHVNDSQGEHGSHVAGIATANAYIPDAEGTFVPALDSVFVQGVAPDAQLIVMKVFGKSGGAYDSDYMVAIEDAVLLGCDAVNLSLGSGNPGKSRNTNAAYQAILENLQNSGVVVAMSAGNSGSWVENANNVGYLYAEDVSMQTNGAPGSFTNSLSVASVTNDGFTALYATVGDAVLVYTESEYSNLPFATIAGEHEYVFIDGVGTEEDWAAVGDALVGKIAFCSRGTTSFYEKAEAAVEAGAIATFIYNNQAGVINMDLSSYSYTQPCASITAAEGAAVKAASTPVTDESGNTLYYTGKITISEKLGVGQYHSTYYTMSSFSSWGVPGSLELKPEITAPGGNIYSIFGTTPDGGGADQYEIMSGTSMASPQVAGMAALVAQYIRENNLEEKTGLDARTLAQSLLMSTAVPMWESASSYYPILRQGAGLANVGQAVTADSYILMGEDATASYADGKVKAELGDDPDREGVYTFSFTIHNMSAVEKSFALSADFFVQSPTQGPLNNNGDYGMFMHTTTALIGADVSWLVNGVAMEPDNALAGLDFNGDGIVNSDDGQAILDYSTGVLTTLHHQEQADIDADGDIDTYDAYLFLNKLSTGMLVLAVGGSAEVTVTATLSDDWKDVLDYYYPNGTYVQGYVFAESMSDAEGNEGTSHSIPVLAFYGNWSDPSMFDVGSYQEYQTGEEVRIPYLGNTRTNTFTVTYANEPDANYYFGGNPMVSDETYMPERNAINSENGDMISRLAFVVIRNAMASHYTAYNRATNELLEEAFPGAVDSAYYYTNGSTWRNTGYNLNVAFTPDGLPEGTQIELAMTLAPEYYVDARGNVDWDALGEGATLSVPMVVDNTAPELKEVSVNLLSNTMTIVASDNQYISAVALYNKTGTKLYSYAGAKQEIQPGEEATYSLDLEGVNGKKFLVQVVDYALNTTTYELEMQIGEELPAPDMLAYDISNGTWIGFGKNDDRQTAREIATSTLNFYAASDVDGMIFASTDTCDLYVLDEEDPSDMIYVANMGVLLTDMAYNRKTGTLYGVADNTLYEIDRLTAEAEAVGEIPLRTSTLAVDDSGNFYSVVYGDASDELYPDRGYIYTYTLETIAEGGDPTLIIGGDEIAAAYDNEKIRNTTNNYVQSLEWNPNDGKVYWASYSYTSYFGGWFTFVYAELFEIDPENRTLTVHEDFGVELTALVIPEKTSGGDWSAPTEQVSGVQLSDTSITLLKGGEKTLSATVLPWTATDRAVRWSSADESIATVNDEGLVTGLKPGTTTVTATSTLDPGVSASCTVQVEALAVTLEGTMQDADGNPSFFTWNMETDAVWTAGTALDTSMTSATRNTHSNQWYLMDAISNSWNMHVINPETGKTEQSAVNTAGVPLWDMQYSEFFSTEETARINSIYYYYFLAPKDPMALDTSAFNLSSRLSSAGASYLVAITSFGYEIYEDDEGDLDTEHIVLLDNAGNIWNFWIYNDEGSYSAFLNTIPTNLGVEFPGDDSGDNMYTSLVVGEDGHLYLSAFTGETNELFRLSYNEAEAIYEAVRIGDAGQDVWPMILTGVRSNVSAQNNPARTPAATDHITSAPVSAAELAACAPLSQNTSSMICTETANATISKEELENGTFNPNSDSEIDPAEDTITVTITTETAATNGLTTVSYDANSLALESVVVNAAYHSELEESGKLTFGYVSLTEIPAEETIATLTFRVLDAVDSVITVEHKQVNQQTGSTETIPVEFEHQNTELRDAVEATCTTAGYTGDLWCLDCGRMIQKGEIIQPKGHSYGEWKVTKEATCTENGEETRTCACGHTETRVLQSEGHDYEATVVEPTCTEQGYTEYVCQTCGHSYRDDFVDALGHSYGEWKVTKEATCTKNGEETRTCACGHTETREIEKKECPSSAFTDLNVDAWYHEGVDYVLDHGLMNGMGNGIFAPDGALTRAELVTVVYRMAGSPSVAGLTNPFADVREGEWYADAVIWAYHEGIVNGVSATTFAPSQRITREQIATMLYRYSGAEKVEENALESFVDAAAISDYAREAMNWAVATGLLNGVGEGKLAPQETATRAQIATILMRFCQEA